MVNSLKEAIAVLETRAPHIPFEAIHYLREQPTTDELMREIVFALNHAYSDLYYDEVNEQWSITPVWFAIVAEAHLDERLIAPVIRLFTSSESDSDWLNEQGMYLIGALSKKYGEKVVDEVIWAIDKLISLKSDMPYLFLFDAFYYVDQSKYKKWLLETLQKEGLFWRESFASHVADLQIKEALPILNQWLTEAKTKKEGSDVSIPDLKSFIRQLQTGESKYPEQSLPYHKTRKDWETHYKPLEKRLADDWDEDEPIDEAAWQEFVKEINEPKGTKDIARNDLCWCGSGKKYKKCHGATA